MKEAAEKGCRVIVLPECLDLGWTHPSAPERAQPIPGPYSDAICQAACEAGIYTVAGLTEREEGRIYNSAIVVSPEGEIILKHRKINILTIAQDIYSVGESLSVVRTELGVLGVDICADNFPKSLALGHCLGRMGAQLILSPCAWAVEADHDNLKEPYGALWREAYTTLAHLYDLTVVGVSNVGWVEGGPWDGRKCIGCSLAVGPGGEVLAKGPYGVDAEALLVVRVRPAGLAVRGTAIAEVLESRGYKGP